MQTKSNLKMHCFPEIKSTESSEKKTVDSKSDEFDKAYFSDKQQLVQNGESQPWPKVQSNDNELERKALIEQAYKDGYETGIKDGIAQEKKKIDNLAGTIDQAIFELEKFKAKLLEEAENSILKLVLAITRKIFFKDTLVERETILLVAQNALKMVVNPTDLIIRVNPEDLETLNENKGLLEGGLGKSASLRIESDASISTGGCVLETNFGDIDASIESQMQMIEKALLSGNKQ